MVLGEVWGKLLLEKHEARFDIELDSTQPIRRAPGSGRKPVEVWDGAVVVTPDEVVAGDLDKSADTDRTPEPPQIRVTK
jgi:hypothetical protein